MSTKMPSKHLALSHMHGDLQMFLNLIDDAEYDEEKHMCFGFQHCPFQKAFSNMKMRCGTIFLDVEFGPEKGPSKN